MRIVFLSSIRIFCVDVDSYNIISQGDILCKRGGARSGVISEFRCRKALILCVSFSSRLYASFVWMWTPITSFPSEICSPLTGGARSGVNSDLRCRKDLIFCVTCSSRPYASFEWMWTVITSFTQGDMLSTNSVS